MKKLVTISIAMLLSASVSAQPDKDWWACQFVKSVGMKWENGRWNEEIFKLRPPFVLMSDGNGGLTKESVAKALSGSESDANITTCEPSYGDGYVSCMMTGDHFEFRTKTGNGGISSLMGTTMQGDKRDTPVVMAFECTKA